MRIKPGTLKTPEPLWRGRLLMIEPITLNAADDIATVNADVLAMVPKTSPLLAAWPRRRPSPAW